MIALFLLYGALVAMTAMGLAARISYELGRHAGAAPALLPAAALWLSATLLAPWPGAGLAAGSGVGDLVLWFTVLPGAVAALIGAGAGLSRRRADRYLNLSPDQDGL